MHAHDQRVGIGRGVRVVEPGIDLPGDRKSVPRLVAAESQGLDVRTHIRLQALEVADCPGGLLARLYRLVCPKSDQDAEGDDGELTERQLPAPEKATHEARCSGAVIRHVDLRLDRR